MQVDFYYTTNGVDEELILDLEAPPRIGDPVSIWCSPQGYRFFTVESLMWNIGVKDEPRLISVGVRLADGLPPRHRLSDAGART